jgi:hypothetical protein
MTAANLYPKYLPTGPNGELEVHFSDGRVFPRGGAPKSASGAPAQPSRYVSMVVPEQNGSTLPFSTEPVGGQADGTSGVPARREGTMMKPTISTVRDAAPDVQLLSVKFVGERLPPLERVFQRWPIVTDYCIVEILSRHP